MDEKTITVAVAALKLNEKECLISPEEPVETVEPVNTTRRTSTSEYDSGDAESYSDGEQGDQSRRSHNSETDSDPSVILEREEGDGQESVPTRKIDDDEDKKNPQYIPKRGTFYEHDDRTVEDDDENPEEKEKAEKEGKKKIWTDKKEKWNHDKFNDNEQAPKSRAELIAIYGYDIRNEDGPPRARRRRRYGRGPNKYTRNWEDEDAYSKPPIVVTKKINKKNKQNTRQDQVDRQDNKSSDEGLNNSQIHIEREHDRSPSSEPASQSNTPKPREANRNFTPASAERQNNKNQRVGTGRVPKPSREIKDSDYRGFTKPRQYAAKPPPMMKESPKERDPPVHTQSFTNRKSMPDLDREREISGKMNQEQQHGKNLGKHNSNNNNNRQGSVPPRLQGEQKGSKRYSSLRQRSLPESATPPFNQQQHAYYANAEYTQQNQVPTNQQQPPPQQIIHSAGPLHPNPAQMPAIPPPPLPTIPQVPVTSTPLPPQFGGPFPQAPPPFLQAAPPPFIPQQTPALLNFVPGQPQFAPPQAPYQGYQQTFPPSQPAEIFQPPGGITYYSAHDQQAAQRAALQKRPKAAIPIIAPPGPEPRGRGRTNPQEDPAPNSIDVLPAENHTEITTATYEDATVQE